MSQETRGLVRQSNKKCELTSVLSTHNYKNAECTCKLKLVVLFFCGIPGDFHLYRQHWSWVIRANRSVMTVNSKVEKFL